MTAPARREVHQRNLTPLALRALLAHYNRVPLTPAASRVRAELVRQLEQEK